MDTSCYDFTSQLHILNLRCLQGFIFKDSIKECLNHLVKTGSPLLTPVQEAEEQPLSPGLIPQKKSQPLPSSLDWRSVAPSSSLISGTSGHPAF